MRADKATRWVVLSLATAVVMTGTQSVASESRVRELVVLYDDAQVSVETLDATLAARGAVRVRGATHERSIRAGDAPRLSAVTWRVPDGAVQSTALAALRRVPGVAHAAPNRRWQTQGAPRDIPIDETDFDTTDVVAQVALDQVGADGIGGTGMTVAVLDGGFDLSHEMLAGHLAPGGWDTLDDDSGVDDLGDGVDTDGDGYTDDLVGHGTFVSGLVLAVAPQAKVLPMRVLDDEGWGTDLALWLAISRAVDEGADVINMSMVVANMPTQLQAEIDTARAAGIVFVTSAGNDGNSTLDHPALKSRAVVVGGVDGNDAVLSWSPSGANVEIYAPADSLIGPLGGATADSYATWSGTSFACALVSGAAALLLETDGTLTPAEVEAALVTNTTTVSGDSGSGLLDIPAAIDAVD